MELLDRLNEQQREAVTTTEGYIRVIAGAGSGKTRALSHRFAYLVNELGIPPGNILCVTFTNKSANEMRERIRRLTGDSDTGYIGTFHSFCVTVLQEDSFALGYPKSFLVLDNGDIDEMLAQIYEERGLTLRHMTFRDARDMIEMRKCVQEPDYVLSLADWRTEDLKARYDSATDPRDIIFYGYLWKEKQCFGLDYNDLIKFTLHIFEKSPELRQKWQERLMYVMVDEFQDIDALQYKLMSVLTGFHKNLFIVGDPDQTIYTWRGADVKFLLEFDKRFPGTKTVVMNRNYRSTPEILDAANALIRKNVNRYEKDLDASLPHGPRVLCHHGASAEEEAVWIVRKIRELQETGVPLRDVAVLYRAHHVTRTLETVLLREKLPYVIYSGVQFFERVEIKDALAYLRLVAFGDDLSFLRVANKPKRNLGRRRIAFLKEYAVSQDCTLLEALRRSLDDDLMKNTKARQLVTLVDELSVGAETRPVSDILTALLDRSGYETALRTEGSQERLDNLAELLQSVREFETGCGEETALPDYLRYAALFTNSDREEKRDAVKLMTVHAAKGLEFPYVFLCAMNEGVFPSRKVRTKPELEEERRLCFVALTRAEKALFLTASDGRSADGSPQYPSRFLLDIGREHMDFTAELPEGLLREAQVYAELSSKLLAEAEAAPEYVPGDRVRHPVFGAGTVLEDAEVKGEHVLVQFDGLPTPRRLSVRIRLEKI